MLDPERLSLAMNRARGGIDELTRVWPGIISEALTRQEREALRRIIADLRVALERAEEKARRKVVSLRERAGYRLS